MAMASSLTLTGRASTPPACILSPRRILSIRFSTRSAFRPVHLKQTSSARLRHLLASSEEAGESSSPTATLDETDQAGENAEEGTEEEAVSEQPTEEAAPKVEEKPRVVYPKGFTRYETMVVLRPDITEEQRLALSQRYEEMIIAGGGMDVEIFNRGIMPLGYSILKKNTRGDKNTYVDGIYYMFTYATKPATINQMQRKLETDDDVIRVMTMKTI